jgi:hypothetical protein
MKLTDADIGSFRDLWKKETGTVISDDQARQYAQSLLGLVQIVAEKPIQRSEEPP